MNRLERRYRRLLRLLPPAYRVVREEEMVDTFLLSMQEDDPDDDAVVRLRGHPDWSERLSIASLSLRLRWGGNQAPARYRVHGGAVRWCVAAIVLIQAASSVPLLLVHLWAAGALLVARPTLPDMSFLFGWSWWLSMGLAASWIFAFVALTQAQRRAAQVFAVLATAPLLVDMVRPTAQSFASSSGHSSWLVLVAGWTMVVVDVGVVLGLSAFHHEAPTLRARPWLVSGTLALVAVGAILLVPGVAPWVLVDDISLWCLGVVVGAIAVLPIAIMPRARTWRSARRAEAYLGLGLLCAAVLVLRATTTAALAVGGWSSAPTSVQGVLVAQLVLVAGIGGTFGCAGLRQLHRMPAVTYEHPAPFP